MRTARLLAPVLALGIVVAGCSSGSDESGMQGMDDMGDMVMNEPDATRADELAGADLRTAPFVRFEDVPEEFADASGTAHVATDDGTTVTLDLHGLPETEIVSHLHAQSCAADGGPHFQFDEGGATVPPNEVHLAGTPGPDGELSLTVTNDRAAEAARSVVFHPREDTSVYVACADLPGS